MKGPFRNSPSFFMISYPDTYSRASPSCPGFPQRLPYTSSPEFRHKDINLSLVHGLPPQCLRIPHWWTDSWFPPHNQAPRTVWSRKSRKSDRWFQIAWCFRNLHCFSRSTAFERYCAFPVRGSAFAPAPYYLFRCFPDKCHTSLLRIIYYIYIMLFGSFFG